MHTKQMMPVGTQARPGDVQFDSCHTQSCTHPDLAYISCLITSCLQSSLVLIKFRALIKKKSVKGTLHMTGMHKVGRTMCVQ